VLKFVCWSIFNLLLKKAYDFVRFCWLCSIELMPVCAIDPTILRIDVTAV
jgi:hypothetical protein